MKISARVNSKLNEHQVLVETNSAKKSINIASKTSGYGSSINGAELLLLSLATCFCNDIYREAAKKSINVSGVNVIVNGEFGADGEPGFNFSYEAKVESDAAPEVIDKLIRHTDNVAEIHNTLRKGLNIRLNQ